MTQTNRRQVALIVLEWMLSLNRDEIILHLEWLGQALTLAQQILKTSIVVGIAPSEMPGPLCWGELLPEGPWHCGGTPVFSWFELLAVNNSLILTTYYLPWYHMFMHWRLNMYFDTCLFIMYVLVCKMRYIPVLVCILGPQMNRKASLEPLHTVE